MYIGQITAATSRLDFFSSAPVIVTLNNRRSINSPPPSLWPVSQPSAPSLCPLPARRCSVSHNQLKTLSRAWVPVMSVRLCSFISLSVSLSVRSSVICSSLSPFVFHQSVSLSVHLSVRLSVRLLSCPSLSVRLSVRPSLCSSLSIRLSTVRLSISHVLRVIFARTSRSCSSL